MKKFVVQISRTEYIAYQLEAIDAADAETRYLMDGEEVASETTRITVDSVDEGSADEVLG